MRAENAQKIQIPSEPGLISRLRPNSTSTTSSRSAAPLGNHRVLLAQDTIAAALIGASSCLAASLLAWLSA